MDAVHGLDFLRVEARGGIVRVWHSRSARDHEEARATLDAINTCLAETGLTLLLFDSRDADRAPEKVQDAIWAWLCGHPSIRKVATLMHSKDRARKVRATSAGRGILLKTFADEEEATRWLIAP